MNNYGDGQKEDTLRKANGGYLQDIGIEKEVVTGFSVRTNTSLYE